MATRDCLVCGESWDDASPPKAFGTSVGACVGHQIVRRAPAPVPAPAAVVKGDLFAIPGMRAKQLSLLNTLAREGLLMPTEDRCLRSINDIAPRGPLDKMERVEAEMAAKRQVQRCLCGSPSTSRHPVFVFSGFPGSGKTRMLRDMCAEYERQYLTLFVTFNSTSPMTNLDQILVSRNLLFPVIARLIHAYFMFSVIPWEDYIEKFTRVCDQFAGLTISTVLDLFRHAFGNEKILLAVDEILMPWNKGYLDDAQTQRMAGAMYHLQDKGSTAVLFSALASGFLDENATPGSERVVNTVHLKPLGAQSVHSLLSANLDAERSKQLESASCLTREGVLALLASFLGGLPRALEYTLIALRNPIKETVMEVVVETARLLANSYRPSKQILQLALLGRSLPSATQIGKYTVLEALRRGLLLDLGCGKNATEIPIVIPPVMLAAYAFAEQEAAELEFQNAIRHLSLIALAKPNDLWEECVRRRNIAVSHCLPRSMKLGDLFCPAVTTTERKLLDMHISIRPLSNRIQRYVIPPTPNDVAVRACRGEFHEWAALSQFEDGVDHFDFFMEEQAENEAKSEDDEKTEDAAVNAIRQTLIAVGFQEKWSADDDQQIFGPDLARAWARFVAKMTSRGWSEDRLVMVFVVRRKLPNYLQNTLSAAEWRWKNVMVVHDIPTWLGPTMWAFAQNLASVARYDTTQDIVHATPQEQEVYAEQSKEELERVMKAYRVPAKKQKANKRPAEIEERAVKRQRQKRSKKADE